MKLERVFLAYFFPNRTPTPASSHLPGSNQLLLYLRIFALFMLTANKVLQYSLGGSLLDSCIYLTNVGFTLAWVFFTLSIQYHLLRGYFPKFGFRTEHLIQLVYELAFSFSLPISIMFWSVLFKDELDSNPSVIELVETSAVHFLPFIFLLVDLFFNSFAFPARHLVLPIALGLIYMLINFLYTILVHKVYDPIDWDSILSYALVFSTILLLLMTFMIGSYSYQKFKKSNIQQNLLGSISVQNVEEAD